MTYHEAEHSCLERPSSVLTAHRCKKYTHKLGSYDLAFRTIISPIGCTARVLHGLQGAISNVANRGRRALVFVYWTIFALGVFGFCLRGMGVLVPRVGHCV